jgi:predicted O-methyltransferase YrrM
VAQRYLGHDPRVQFVVEDGEAWLKRQPSAQFDLIFADSFPGKYYALDEALNTLKIGGLYVIDDLLPQPNWPDGHQTNVDRLITTLGSNTALQVTKLAWASGIIIATKVV